MYPQRKYWWIRRGVGLIPTCRDTPIGIHIDRYWSDSFHVGQRMTRHYRRLLLRHHHHHHYQPDPLAELTQKLFDSEIVVSWYSIRQTIVINHMPDVWLEVLPLIRWEDHCFVRHRCCEPRTIDLSLDPYSLIEQFLEL